jgi:hypothetical protein
MQRFLMLKTVVHIVTTLLRRVNKYFYIPCLVLHECLKDYVRMIIYLAKAKVMLRPTVSRQVCLGFKHPSAVQGQMWGAFSD